MSQESGFPPEELKKFTDAGRTIAGAVGTTTELWAYAEMGVVLKAWAGRVKVRKDRPLEVSGILRAYRVARRVAGMENLKNKGGVRAGDAGINLGLRRGQEGRVWYRTRTNKKFQPVYGPAFSKGWHIRSSDWPRVDGMVSNFRAHLAATIRSAKGAAGLSRQAVIQIADSLGIKLESVKGGGTLSNAGLAKARRAMPSNGRRYANGFGRHQRGDRGFVEAILRYPLAQATGMDTALFHVLRGRMKFFQRNLEEGVFLSAKAAAKAYPYLEVLRLSS